MKMTLKSWCLLILLSGLWGGTFFFTSIAVRELPPLTVVFLRVGLAAFALLAYLRLRRASISTEKSAWRAYWTMGLLNNVVPFSLFFWAQTKIPGGLASIANAATPVFSIVLAHLLLADERLTSSKLLGVLVSFSGVALLFTDVLTSGANIATVGLSACLLAALCQGFAVV